MDTHFFMLCSSRLLQIIDQGRSLVTFPLRVKYVDEYLDETERMNGERLYYKTTRALDVFFECFFFRNYLIYLCRSQTYHRSCLRVSFCHVQMNSFNNLE